MSTVLLTLCIPTPPHCKEGEWSILSLIVTSDSSDNKGNSDNGGITPILIYGEMGVYPLVALPHGKEGRTAL